MQTGESLIEVKDLCKHFRDGTVKALDGVDLTIRKGDVIVFKMSSSKGHVGIAISDSMMVDASSGQGEVVRRSFKTDYWRKYFYCAYRIF